MVWVCSTVASTVAGGGIASVDEVETFAFTLFGGIWSTVLRWYNWFLDVVILSDDLSVVKSSIICYEFTLRVGDGKQTKRH